MKKILSVFIFLIAFTTVMAQNRVMDTLTFYRGGKIYKLKLYCDHLTINDTSFYGFPGFAKIADSIPWIHTLGNKTVLRNPYDTVIASTINTHDIISTTDPLYLQCIFDSTNHSGLLLDPTFGFILFNRGAGFTNTIMKFPACDHGIMLDVESSTSGTRYMFDSTSFRYVGSGKYNTHIKNLGNSTDRWKLYGKDVDVKGTLFVSDSDYTARTTLEAGNSLFMARIDDIPNKYSGGFIIVPNFGTAFMEDSNYAGFLSPGYPQSKHHFIGVGSTPNGNLCLGSLEQPWDTTYSRAYQIDPLGYVGFRNRVNPAWGREGLDFGSVAGISLKTQTGPLGTDVTMINLTDEGIDFQQGNFIGGYTVLKYMNLDMSVDLPELRKANAFALAPYSCSGILGNPLTGNWWDWIYSKNLTINDSVYLNNLNTGTSSDSLIVGESKTNFGSVFTTGRTGKTTLLKKVKNNSANWNTAFGWGNHSGLYWAKADTGSNGKLAGYYWSTVQNALKANLASPSFTGTVTLPASWKINTTTVTTTAARLNYLSSAAGTTGTTSTNLVFSTSPTLVTPVLGVASGTNYNATVGTGTQPYACTSTTVNTNLNADMVDGYHAADLKLRSEIVPLFGIGIDSTLINTTFKFPMGYSNGIVLDSLALIATTTATGGSVNLTAKVRYGASIADTGTAVIYAGTAATSRTAVTKAYAFTNGTIAKGNMIWLVFSATTTKPRNFMIQLIGHKL